MSRREDSPAIARARLELLDLAAEVKGLAGKASRLRNRLHRAAATAVPLDVLEDGDRFTIEEWAAGRVAMVRDDLVKVAKEMRRQARDNLVPEIQEWVADARAGERLNARVQELVRAIRKQQLEGKLVDGAARDELLEATYIGTPHHVRMPGYAEMRAEWFGVDLAELEAARGQPY